MSATDFVILECVKEGSKLRVKMKTPGYLVDANCQFPRDLRIEGRKFKVPTSHIKLMTQSGKYFYSVKNKSVIQIITDDELAEKTIEEMIANTRVYEDTDIMECSVCLCNEKSIVFIPCGHFYTCRECSGQLKTCPICRAEITESIDKALFG
jgi:hypothetical protein